MHARAKINAGDIQRAVLRIRGQNVLLDADLAELYGVDVRVLNQAVARNAGRFPTDFRFRLTAKEADSLRSQFVILENQRGGNSLKSQVVTLDRGRGRHRKYLPSVFTEQGVAMLSSVLRSPRAVRVNIQIMRAFVQLRRMLSANDELARKLAVLERKYDGQFRVVFEAIRELMAPTSRSQRSIGFRGVHD
jgi:ORF6N domain-containing protein